MKTTIQFTIHCAIKGTNDEFPVVSEFSTLEEASIQSGAIAQFLSTLSHHFEDASTAESDVVA